MAYMLGELKQDRNFQQGLIYLKRAASFADEDSPESAYTYGLILAREFNKVIIPDDLVHPYEKEAGEYIRKAANLGYSPALLRMGRCHEFGELGCTCDPNLSLGYYRRAAEKGEVEAEMALSRWYLCGAEGFFDPNEELAFVHAKKAANKGLASAEFALGYYYEIGIYVDIDTENSNAWYMKVCILNSL